MNNVIFLCYDQADAVLALGDEQFAEGLKLEAMLNYHTACVFFRVMETMIPSKTSSNQHSKLVYVAQRTRQASTIYQNFVRENFTGGSCSDTYEVHGTSKLGKGSYGSVYLATHRITGDERAVKVMNVDRITSYYLRKLHTEIAILKSLDHPNIIKLQDVFFGKRSVYIVTDLCRGGELFELLNSGKNQGFVFREGERILCVFLLVFLLNPCSPCVISNVVLMSRPRVEADARHALGGALPARERHRAPRPQAGELPVRGPQLQLAADPDRLRAVQAHLSWREADPEGRLLLLHRPRGNVLVSVVWHVQ
jgi:hypothetical protein